MNRNKAYRTNKAYREYVNQWIKDHISDEVMKQTKALYINGEYAEDMSFQQYVSVYGFSDGSCFASYREWLDNEGEE